MDSKTNKIAIVCVAYNREKSLSRLLASISKAYIDDECTIIISIDKSDNPLVKEIAENFQWIHGEKRVVAHPENLGLRKHIMGCGKYFEEFDAIIMLEDDLIVSNNFYEYAKQSVDFYNKDNRIAGISLYSFPINYLNFYPFSPSYSNSDVFFIKCAQSWGQVWMKNQWSEFIKWLDCACDEFDINKLPRAICSWSSKSWLKYHTRYCIENNKYFVYPYQSLTSNSSETGVHARFSTPVFETILANRDCKYHFKLEELSNSSIRYDGYFESENIYDYLRMSPSELCIDLNRYKYSNEGKRYLLTTKIYNYKILKSYGLSMRPIEQNIINNVGGDNIFLYDTKIKSNNNIKSNSRLIYAYYNNTDIFANLRRIFSFGIINFIRILKEALK